MTMTGVRWPSANFVTFSWWKCEWVLTMIVASITWTAAILTVTNLSERRMYMQTDRQTDRQTDSYSTGNNGSVYARLTDRETERQTDRQTERQTDGRTEGKTRFCRPFALKQLVVLCCRDLELVVCEMSEAFSYTKRPQQFQCRLGDPDYQRAREQHTTG